MALSIGGRTVTTWRGQITPARKLTAVVEAPPGVDGTGVIIGAWKRGPFRISTGATFASGALAIAEQEAYRALIGTAVTVVDQFAVSHTGVIVLDVDSRLSETLLATVRVDADWVLLPTAGAPA